MNAALNAKHAGGIEASMKPIHYLTVAGALTAIARLGLSQREVGPRLESLHSVSPTHTAATRTALPSPSNSDTARVDTAATEIRWKGTKFGKRGAHAGTLRVRSGWIDVRGMQPRSGRILLDMRSIAVTDIPRSDMVPRRKLLEHLVGEEFFAVSRFPTAEFTLDRAEKLGANVFRVNGRLTLRGVTKPVTFEMTIWSYEPTALRATAQLTFNRMDWGVAFRGSRLTNDLVDDDVQLEIDITARGSAS